jgi:serine/threonine protein kinase
MIIHNRYRPGAYLEHGPLGDVFLAEDTTTGLLVVVRALERHLTIDPDVLAAFERDMAALRELDLPTIAAVQATFYHEDRLHLVAPYLPGQTLDQYFQQHGPLSPVKFQDWAISLTRTLSEAHLAEVVHGDLRPSNIFVVPKNAPPPYARREDEPDAYATIEIRPVDVDLEDAAAPTLPHEPAEPHPADTPGDVRLIVVDFGLYHLFEGRRLATTSARLNLSNYTSPQRWQGQSPPGISDDIWNVGVLFFQMTSGRLPFDARSDAAIMQRVLHFATPNLRGRVPRGIVAIIERLLEKDPWRRYRSLPAVLTDLERGSVRWPGRRAGLMPRERSPWVSWVLFILLILLLVVVPAGGGAALVASNQPTPTAIEIAGVVFPPTPTLSPTPLIVPFQPSPVGPPSDTPTASPTWTPIVITNTPTLTYTPSDTPTASPTASITPSRTPTASPTATATPSSTPTITATASATLPPSPTASLTATSSPQPSDTASPTATTSPTATATATPTATANATVTANFENFLTRAAAIQATQFALETQMAPTEPPDLTATTIALSPAAATLSTQRVARTMSSAVGLCHADETLVNFSNFAAGAALNGDVPADFLIERIEQDTALHLTRTGTWTQPIPVGYTRLRFDLLAPRALTPPLTVSFVPAGTGTDRIGWRLTWSIGSNADSTGLLLERVQDGEPVTVSSLVAVPFDTWVTVDMGFQPLGEDRTIFTLTVYTADGPNTALLVINNEDLTPFQFVAINATIDSAPWLDNFQVCNRAAPVFFTPTPLPAE